MSQLDPDAAPPLRFEDGRWLFIHEGVGGCRFVRLGATSAAAMAHQIVSNGCTDVIAFDLASATVEPLTASGVRLWHAPGTSARALVNRFKGGTLPPFMWHRDESSSSRV